ncbi:MAG: cytochrome c oxidase subunit II [Firmicutes bacterium]|nr:cytochrome c oxidase subunit II [Bacillota bacterium]MCL5064374.1 cytochrome c oxidase subunit II [Bacillota bacterium]
MFAQRLMESYRKLVLAALAVGAGLLSAGFSFGPKYVLLHPAGPVAKSELHVFVFALELMAIVAVVVLALFFYAIVRFRDTAGNRAPYTPNWHSHTLLEVSVWILPAILLLFIAIPTVKTTFSLAHLPKGKKPVVIDVTSLTWKWLFEYPKQHIATVNYAVIPANRPVLFELTADSPMNTFWVPQLGGMEYTMPNRVLPLWLEADKAGTYWGHSGQFSGVGFEKMFFNVKAVSQKSFQTWTAKTASAHPMTMAAYDRLLKQTTVGDSTYGNYPADTFPTLASGFSLTGSGMYMVQHDKKGISYLPMVGS